MRCIEQEGVVKAQPSARRCLAVGVVVALTVGALAACGSRSGGAASGGSTSTSAPPTSTAPTSRPTAGTSPAPLPTATGGSVLAAPTTRVRNWTEYQRQAARRLVAANPTTTYTGVPPEPLLAVPVLEVELNADGTVRRVNVMRTPTQAQDTIQLAVNAIHRAAPYGDVTHLPRPWKFTEVFLFDDNRRFKPRTLD